ncbi:MAG: ester cyclase [Muribaculaceae bacterium]
MKRFTTIFKRYGIVLPLVCLAMMDSPLTACHRGAVEDAKDVVKAFFHEGYETHNYDYVMQCVADDYIDHSPAAARSNADAVGILKIVREQFPDMKVTFLDVFAEDDMVATRIRFEGTHSATCQGVAASGRHITFEALENFRVRDNKIVESWGYWPDEEIRRQLTAAD